MKIYQISYDLRNQRNYEALYERIRNYGTYCHALESTWLIGSNQTASSIRDDLAKAMDRDDGLLVTRLQGEGAWQGLDDRLSKWIKDQLEACSA